MKLQHRRYDVSPKIEEFAQYLNSSDRIILSAKFGDGKTYFLNELTKDKNLSEEYEFFTVYPVNYSVATNEDVFEYIKRDIILQMHERDELNKIDINALFEAVKSFVDISSVVSFLLSFIPCGDLYFKIFERFKKAKEDYKEKQHLADEYLKMFENQRGGLYEKDGYTELIRETIKWIQEDHGSDHKAKKTVLIFEDLDRLDPQHLFRILNVLSAHIDDTSKPNKVDNKFGFDNIVLVMDYETTENIFHHFYGSNANYQGYMSKFLACEPFRYSMRDYLERDLVNQLTDSLFIGNVYPHMSNLPQRIHSLSIRDITRLCNFDTNCRIKRDYIEMCGQEWGVSTSLPLFHLIIFMIECGLSIKEIVQDLSYKHEYDDVEYATLLFPLFYMTQKPFEYLRDSDNIIYYCHIEKNQDGDLSKLKLNYTNSYRENNLVQAENLNAAPLLDELFKSPFGQFIDASSAKWE